MSYVWFRGPAGGAHLRACLETRTVADQKTGLWRAAIDKGARHLLKAEEV